MQTPVQTSGVCVLTAGAPAPPSYEPRKRSVHLGCRATVRLLQQVPVCVGG